VGGKSARIIGRGLESTSEGRWSAASNARAGDRSGRGRLCDRGPAYETASKPGYGPEIGRKGLAEIAQAARVPVLAIGGINVARVAEVLAAGRPALRSWAPSCGHPIRGRP